MRPIVGLIALYDDNKESYWMLPGYMKGLEEAGVIPVMLPLTKDQEIIEELVQSMDGFLLTGGHDVTPSLYGEEPHSKCTELCYLRDQMESHLINTAIKMDKPILGICRGIQILNVVMGGSLYQDIPEQTESTVTHQQTPPYEKTVHSVNIHANTPLHTILGKDCIDVNSYHHQGIKQLADSLKPMAEASDGIIEAVYRPDSSFVFAVQWHPEFTYLSDENSKKIFQAFAYACESEKED